MSRAVHPAELAVALRLVALAVTDTIRCERCSGAGAITTASGLDECPACHGDRSRHPVAYANALRAIGIIDGTAS